MPKRILIDAHQDIAYNMLTFARDYRLAAGETRQREIGTEIPLRNGHTLLGWPDYQYGQVALIFATLFVMPQRYASATWETLVYHDLAQAGELVRRQLDLYHRLSGDHSDQFRLVLTRKNLDETLVTWESVPAAYPETTHPVGLVLSMESAEGIRNLEELEEFWERGLRWVGPVWAGWRFCGGMYEPGGFTGEGYELLERMAALGYGLDIAHMNGRSALQALDAFPGPIIASHANAQALLSGLDNERHLSDAVIRHLVERNGVMGVVPYNGFLRPGWRPGDNPQLVTLDLLANHIDYICQIAGSARHVALGTDFDGGFGYGAVPVEINTIADLQKLDGLLAGRGYSDEEITAIFSGNWRRQLERVLPP
ncbi:MAG TPA: membrane dipeptidase [Levilinea sp.]|nr:membrane dipeptidase [Levilinea sp.]